MACGCHDKKDGPGPGFGIALILLTIVPTVCFMASKETRQRYYEFDDYVGMGFFALVFFFVCALVIVGVIAAIVEGIKDK